MLSRRRARAAEMLKRCREERVLVDLDVDSADARNKRHMLCVISL
jgi:hypothetical protein